MNFKYFIKKIFIENFLNCLLNKAVLISCYFIAKFLTNLQFFFSLKKINPLKEKECVVIILIENIIQRYY